MFNGQPPGVYMPGYTNRSSPTTNNDDSDRGGSMAGTNIEAKEDHLDALCKTESNTVKCVWDYRNHLKHIIRFWKEKYPEYYNEVVFDLLEEQRVDKRCY